MSMSFKPALRLLKCDFSTWRWREGRLSAQSCPCSRRREAAGVAPHLPFAIPIGIGSIGCIACTPGCLQLLKVTETGSAWMCDPGHLASRRVAHFQQDVGDLAGEALSATGDQNAPRSFGIERRSWHAMLKQHPRAACPVTILDRFVA